MSLSTRLQDSPMSVHLTVSTKSCITHTVILRILSYGYETSTRVLRHEYTVHLGYNVMKGSFVSF